MADEQTIEIRIPQLGEGLQEARIVRFIKEPGDSVEQDEPIYEMETDKAVMEIESPAAGRLVEWTAAEDDVLPIGAVIGRLATDTAYEVADGGAQLISEAPIGETPEARRAAELQEQTEAPAPAPAAAGAVRNATVPPRTRAYAKEKGVSEEDLARLAEAAGHRLLPGDIDEYLVHIKSQASGVEEADSQLSSLISQLPSTLSPLNTQHSDTPLPARQKTLNYRLRQSANAVIPATMEMMVEWDAVEEARAALKQRDGDAAPTQFLLFAWCVAQAAKDHPRFRSALAAEGTLREYGRLHLGIAVARPDDELLMARVEDADALSFEEFTARAREAIHRARDGQDQAGDVMQLSLTNMASAGVRFGIPVVVAPAMGTIFIGAPYDEAFPQPNGSVGFRRVASMVLTFDHRIANGVGAARFLADVKARVEGLREQFS